MVTAFKLEILTLKRTVYSGMVTSVIAPGTEGKFGILVRHAPMISSLQTGALKIREPARQEVWVFVAESFLMVEKGNVVILSSRAEMPHEIDVERAIASQDRARRRLREKPTGLDVARAEAALARSLARLKVAGAS